MTVLFIGETHAENVFGTGRGAFAAARAGTFIHAPAVEREAVEKTVERAERAEVLAEGPVVPNGANRTQHEDAHLPEEAEADDLAELLVEQGQRDAAKPCIR